MKHYLKIKTFTPCMRISMDEKILVVEGERKFRELYQTGLKDAG